MTFDMDLNDATIKKEQRDFDRFVLSFATECIDKGLIPRFRAVARLLRSHHALEALRTAVSGAGRDDLMPYLFELTE